MTTSSEIAIPVPTAGPPGDAMPATLVRPESGHGGGIVLVQEIFGRSDYMRERAQDLASAGYTVVLPQVFWRIGIDTIPEDSAGALDTAMEAVDKIDWALAVEDVRTAVAWMRAYPHSDEAVALIGFCFGGGLAYAALQDAPREGHADALVSYYGSALPNLVDGASVRAESLHHFGDSDVWIPTEAIEHIREVVERDGAEFHLWDGANHAFDNPSPELGLHDPR
ncbi:MAG: dienelactone hydrolase family protein, partial [Dermatophilus congolensis]|nr:dienelactone hydrolase family protein [Dermatophilus congolensis]